MIEVFELTPSDVRKLHEDGDTWLEEYIQWQGGEFIIEDWTGWYWWECEPGCLPNHDPIGPFTTQQSAMEDATI